MWFSYPICSIQMISMIWEGVEWPWKGVRLPWEGFRWPWEQVG